MKRFCVLLVAVAVAGLAASPLWAQSSSWLTNAAGNWSTAGDWAGGIVAGGAGNTADFTQLSGNTNAVTYDSAAPSTIGNMIFGLGAGSIASAGYTLTLQTTAANTMPTITVEGSTTTISTALAGSQGFVLTGGGNLTLTTNAPTFTGNIIVNQGTLNFTGVNPPSTSGLALNNGTTLAGNTGLSATNVVQIVSGTASLTTNSSGSLYPLFSGNGAINWAGEATITTVTYGYTPSACIFGNFGGTIYWGTSSNGLRIESSSSSTQGNDPGNDSVNPFATFDFGSGNGTVYTRNGTTVEILGALANGGATSGSFADTNSGGHDNFYIIGSANENTTFNGQFKNGSDPTAFAKVGIGSMMLTGISTATDTYQSGYSYGAEGGTLGLNFATNTSNLLASGGVLGIGQGGTLYLLGNSGASTSSSQTMASTTIGAGGGSVVVNPNGGAATTLNLNALTATAVGSTLNVSVQGAGGAVTTTSNTGSDGTYGARVTYTDASGNTDFATVLSGASTHTLGRYTGYSNFTGNGDSLSADYALVGNGALAVSDTVNLLKISTNGPGQSLGGAFTLTLSGALLFTGSNNYSINTSVLNSMLFTSGGNANADILIHNFGTGGLTINAKMNNNNGNATLTLDGPGTTVLTNTANSFNGSTYIDGSATLSTSSALVLGGTGNATALNLFGGTFQATQSFSLSNGTANHNVTIGGGGGTFDVTAGNTLTVSGSISNYTTSAANHVVASYYGPLIKTDAGTLVLSNSANAYYGATIIDGGVLSVGVLTNGNSLSGIGQSPSAAPALVLNGGILQYTGPATSTDRSFVLTPNGGGIDASGSGPLVFSTTSNVMLVPPPIVTTGLLAGSGQRLLTLTGTYGSTSNTFAGQIVDGTGTGPGGISPTSLVKTGPGWWTLTNNNTYSGSTTVNNGTLTLSSPLSNNNIAASTLINVGFNGTLDLSGLSNSTLALAGGQTLTGQGVVSGSVTAGALSNIEPGAGAANLAGTGASNISGNLSLLNNSGLTFGLNSSLPNANILSVGGTLSLPASGGTVNVALYSPNTGSPFTPPSGTSTYDIIQYGPLFSVGSLTGAMSDLSVSNPNTAYSYSFGTTNVSGQNYIDLTITELAVAGLWATNGPGNWSSSINWAAGVAPHNAGDTATFASAITSSATVTLDQPETVSSVTFSNTASYTIAGTNALTFSSTSGASVNSTLGSHFIAVPVNLATNAGAVVSNGAALTLSGAVSGTGSLTKNGNGTLVLSASNGYGPAAGTVGTTINAGTVQLGNNAALSTGDVSVAGNSTIQAGAWGLTLANNFIIGGGTTATFDTQGQTLTVTGLISESPPSSGGALTVIGAGTLVVTASNTYTGTTTITSATLQLDNGGSNGYVGGPIVDNGTLALDRGDTALVLSSSISGNGNLAQIGAGMSTLNAANTFSGQTTISAGTLLLTNSLALQDSTLVFNNPNGTLSFGTLTAASVGALTGSLSMALQNSSGSAVALEVGDNTVATASTYSGNFSGSGSLEWDGPGSWTLTGSNNIGGYLQMSNNNNVGRGGNLILPAGSSLTVTSLASYGIGGANLLTVSGGTLNVSGVSTILGASNGAQDGNGGLLVTGGLCNLTGGLNFATDNKDGGVLTQVQGGTLNCGTINMGRSSLIDTTQPAAGSTASGIYVTNGVVNVTGSVNIGTASDQTNSSASFRIDGGAVNVSGPVVIGLNNGGRWSVLDENGGSLVVDDTTSGILIGGPYAGDAEFLVRAGVANVQLVTFGQSAVADTVVLNLTGGQLYVGAGGMVLGSASATPEIYLAGGTLGATAPWSSDPSLPITLTGGSSSGITVQSADQFGNGNMITFNGAVTGTGATTITGTGGLVLNNTGNTYSGNTNINGGSLVAGAANALSPYSAVILNNGLLDPSIGPQTIASLTINGGSVNLNSAVTLSSLTMSATPAYTLAAGSSGSLTFTYNSAAGTNAVITATGGSQTLLAPITLASNQTDIYATGSSTLAIGGGILDGTGGSTALLTFSSPDDTGVLLLSGSNNFGGGFTVYSGAAIVQSPDSLLDGSNVSVGNQQELQQFASIVPATAEHASAVSATAVPEPATAALMFLGLLSGGICCRVRARKLFCRGTGGACRTATAGGKAPRPSSRGDSSPSDG